MDSDLSDEENANIVFPRPRRIIRLRPNHFNEWKDSEFYKRFRLSKQTDFMVLNRITPLIENKTDW